MAEESHCSWTALCAVIIPSLHCKLLSPISLNKGFVRSPEWKSELWWDCQRGGFLSSAFIRECCHVSSLTYSAPPPPPPPPKSSLLSLPARALPHKPGAVIKGIRLCLRIYILSIKTRAFSSIPATHKSLLLLRDLLPAHQPTHTYTGRSPWLAGWHYNPHPPPRRSLSLSHSLFFPLCVIRLLIDNSSLELYVRLLSVLSPVHGERWSGGRAHPGVRHRSSHLMPLSAEMVEPSSRSLWSSSKIQSRSLLLSYQLT